MKPMKWRFYKGWLALALALHAAAVGATEVSSVSSSKQAAEDGNSARVRILHFAVSGNTLLDEALIERTLAPYLGEAKSYTDIQRALEALEGEYRKAGYSAVHVVTPEQEITAGVVALKVVESAIGKLILTGNLHYDEANVRNALPALQQGVTPSARRLSENIRLANENPTRQLDVVLSVSGEEDKVDARVNVQDTSPHKFFLTLDNTGNRTTGDYRVGAAYQHNNLFNRDHAATFSYATSPDHTHDVKQVSASYRLPVYAWGDSLDFIAAYSDVDSGSSPTVAGPLSFSGKGRVFGVHYNHYLPRRGDYSDKLILGLDYRAYINNCTLGEFGAAGCGSAAADVTVHPASLTYAGQWVKSGYAADFSIAGIRNLPGGKRGDDAAFEAVRPSPNGGRGAPADYAILRLGGSLAGMLPQGWQYRMAGSGQYTNDALVPGEQFGLAGASAVRGFMEREVARDKGYFLNAELYTPELAQKVQLTNGSLRLLAFVDHGRGWNENLAGEEEQASSIGSAGLGLRFSYRQHLNARLDWARVIDAGGNRDAGAMRGHLGVVLSF